ncbi:MULTISPECIES: type IV secretion system protein [Bacteria]|uniref:VirB6 protein n=2 Tax=Bacteria TaxID=2 RepID=A0AAU9ASF1_LYSEN|nr:MULTISPECIES: type IV secretion system protein [Bacteria]BAV98903.1 VirB6 protein [Lysobacter enzymogenes]
MLTFSLMFERTKSMFARWLQYGLGTMFSMAVLSFTVTVAMKMVAAVAANFATQYLTMMALGAGDSPGVNTMALQQGGLGIFLTVLILSVPPMASSFFQGALGNFVPQSIFGANAAASRQESPGGHQSNRYQQGAPGGSANQQRMEQNQHTNQSIANASLGSGKRASEQTDVHAKDRSSPTDPPKDKIKNTENRRPEDS